MKAPRALVPLLILSLSACAGPSLPFQAKPDPSTVAIQKAYNALMDNYVDQPSSAVLLQGAYQGTRQALTDAGIQDTSLAAPAWAQNRATNWDHFAQAYSQISGKYGQQIGSTKLEYAAIQQMTASLKDCQTIYYTPAAVQERQQELAGNQQQFGGIGVIMKNIPDHPTVLRVLQGPAQSAGLKPGDEIVAIDGKPTAGETFAQVRDSIRGPQGSTVKITVKRPGVSAPIEMPVQRAQIQAPIIDAAILGGTTGYIHLYSFPNGIGQEIDNALNIFNQRGVDGIIFDVRANTGGDQQTILQVLSRFVKNGTVETQIDRNGQKTPFSVDPSLYWKNPKPLVVLADDDTQAGGEMFAKAMQEEGGYRVVGSTTAGCAASAHTFDLGDGSAMEISTAKIVSGQGQEINRVGVKPDQQVAYPIADLAAGEDPQLAAAIQDLRSGTVNPAPAAAASSGTAPAQTAPIAGAGALVKPAAPRVGSSPIVK